MPPISVGGQLADEPAGLQLNQPASTGSRLGLTPMETPASIEVIPGETIRARGYETVNQAAAHATGYKSTGDNGNGGTALSTRGFDGHGSVAQLYDGTRFAVGAGTVTFPFDTWTVDRLEVLHGPASVLYGAGGVGGAINVVPKRPSSDFRNEAEIGFGSDMARYMAAGSGGPLGGKLSYRADVVGRKSDGFVDRGESESLAFALALRADVSDNLAVTLSHDYGYQKPSTYFGTPLINGRLDESLRERNFNVTDSLIEYRDNWTQLKFDWQARDDVKVSNTLYALSTDRHWRNLETYKYNAGTGLVDRSDFIEILHDQQQYGNRADVSVDNTLLGLKNQTVVGFDVSRTHFRHKNNFDNANSDSVDPYNLVPGNFDYSFEAVQKYRTVTQQYALFTEDRLSLTKDWTLVGSLRYDHADLQNDQMMNPARNFEKTFANVTWRAGTVYNLNAETALYGQYATAVDPVGGIITLSPSNRGYTLATGEQYEAGIKQSVLNGRGEWTFAGYHIVKKDLTAAVPGSPSLTQQIGQQSSRGVELAAGFDITPAWRLEGNAALLDARFDKFTEDDGSASGASRRGNTPPKVPEVMGNLWLTWSFAPEWKARGALRYVGETYSDNANQFKQPDYFLADAGVEWSPTKAFSMALRVYNLFDKVYPATTYGDQQWILGAPRTVMLSSAVKF